MQLKVGELARRSGVTVRALHHYDSIGLLRPSGRSESGYRLYDRDDVARLHGIQAMRQMGVPLAEMAPLLDGGTAALQKILARQAGALDQELARLQALRERVGVIGQLLAGGGQPAFDDWLSALAMMNTLERYFSAGELSRAFERWARTADDWPPLVQALRAAMARGVEAHAVEIQPLVGQWIDLATRWMDGDIGFLGRWGRMLREQPGLPLPAGLDLALLDFVDRAIAHRQAAGAQHFSPQERQRLLETRLAWRSLALRTQQLVDDRVPPQAAAARALAGEWQALQERSFGGDAALRERVYAAYDSDPRLQAGLPFTPALRRYLEQAAGP